DMESNTLTLKLPQHETSDEPMITETSTPRVDDVVRDEIINEVLSNVPQRSLKNIKYIMDKMSKAKHLSSWTDSGEFVFKGKTIEGSHMLDLLKHITMPHHIRDDRRPAGWHTFLEAFADLNIPFSTISNHHVRRTIESIKRGLPVIDPGAIPKGSLKKRQPHKKSYIQPLSNTDDDVFNSPALNTSGWLSF
ncbi:MAG: hypothetical protein ACRCZO_07300, partial [Cetobacterium sp.]